MAVKVKKNLRRLDMLKKNILRGQRNARYNDKIISIKKKSYNYNLT